MKMKMKSLSIQRTCLNPRLSLRLQMYISFGTTAFIAISAFVMIGLYTTVNSGDAVRNEASHLLEVAIIYSLGRSAQYLAETTTKKFENIGGAGSIISEATRDRFAGYQRHEGWKTDDLVPFEDTITGLQVYPLDLEPLPLDWEVTGNINADNQKQHMPGRNYTWYDPESQLSSASGVYFMQGICDPSQTDPNHPTYYPDCTEDNNNILTGGVVHPTETNYYIATKAKDLVWVLKPIYEAHWDIKTVGVYFANDGAGSAMWYPANRRNGNSNFTSYGCDWMNVTHPKTGRPVGTPEQIARCAQKGEVQTNRRYNPMERQWCADQVQLDIDIHSKKISEQLASVHSYGPYLDASKWGNNDWIMTFGQATFDMITHDFVACTLVDVSLGELHDTIYNRPRPLRSTHSAIIKWDEEGTVVVATHWDPRNETTPTNVTDPKLELGVTEETYNRIRNLVDYSEEWDRDDVFDKYLNSLFKDEETGRLIMTHPIPSIPEKYDELYEPVYFVILSITEEDAYDVLYQMEDKINEGVDESVKRVLIVGGTGFGVIILSIAFISGTLTQPLEWMQRVAAKIVDNAGGHDLGQAVPTEEDAADAKPPCSPRTEVTLLLAEFITMVNGFSGVGAAEVTGNEICEVLNRFEWKKMYRDLYPWGVDSDEESDGLNGFQNQFTMLPNGSNGKGTDDTFEDDLTVGTTTSIFSLLSGSLPPQYQHMVENAVEQTTTALTSVKEYAVMAGTKAGLIAEPEPEKVEGPPKVHCGQNVVQRVDQMNDYFEGVEHADNSYLFWWTTAVVGTPILVTAIMISLFAQKDNDRNIPEWLSDVRQKSEDIEINTLLDATRTRAAFGDEVMQRFARDLHLYTRVAGWLLMGSLRRSDSMTFQAAGAEQCKYYGNDHVEKYNGTCPFNVDDTLTPCLCEWEDPWPNTNSDEACKWLNETTWNTSGNPYNTSSDTSSIIRKHARYWQHRWFKISASDYDEKTGDRYSTSFPEVDYQPNATNWWNDSSISKMPGAEKGSNASGYETVYDRTRVLSALSVADFPLYNYYVAEKSERLLGTYMGMEADGSFQGFSGCDNDADAPFFRSDDGNKAYDVNHTLCPKGKYGYDSRCRAWFVDSYADRGFMHVTSPYAFAVSGYIGMSAGAAVIDQTNQKHVGEALIDFSPGAFLNALKPAKTAIGRSGGGFPIVITPTDGANTVVGPNFTEGQNTAAIGDVVLPNDLPQSDNRRFFEIIAVSGMRSGGSSWKWFNRTTNNQDQETVYMAYAPVRLRTERALNSSDFAAGVEMKVINVYILGFAITTQDLLKAFDDIREKVDYDIGQVDFVVILLSIAAILMVMNMTYTMTVYLAQPILILVGIVRSIADKSLGDELPPLQGGSKEIHGVYDSLTKLSKIVRFSNAAYLKGNRTKSYKILEEAIELFQKMGNQKALGVANNNLGTMVLQDQMEKSSITSTSKEALLAGEKYFDEAIRIGTFEYQNAEFDDTRGDFVKQLANRYFNRGMYHIINRNHPEADFEFENRGCGDLNRAKSLDQEAYLIWRERGQSVSRAKVEFFSVLRRARGMLTLIEASSFTDIWGIDTLIDKAFDMIHNPAFADSALFENVNLTARKQQVDDLKIQYALSKGETQEAAKIAMRILVEDEYVIDTVLMNCVTTINKYYDLEHDDPNQVPNLAEGLKTETRRGQIDAMRVAKNVIFCLDYSGSMAGERMQRANMNLRWMYEEHCLDKDYVGFCRFNHAVDDKLYFELERKGGKQEQHDAILGQALNAEGGTRLYAALNRCVTMSLDCNNNLDTWIVALTDGESAWDFPASQVIKRIEKYNKMGGPQIHVIIIGFECPPEVADSVAIITRITEKSLYIDAQGGLDSMDNAFERVANVITGTAITMETF